MFDPVKQEHQHRQKGIELIASESFASDEVMQAMGNCMTNRYAKRYPGERYCGGCEVVDKSENLAIEHVKKLFGAEYANTQPHSGAQASMAVLFTCLKPGDTFMGLNLDHDDHLSHGLPVNNSGILYNPIGYNLSKETSAVDYDKMEQLARQHKSKFIIVGRSVCYHERDYARFREIVDEVGIISMVGMAHPVGLIATGLLENPVEYVHIVISTTHETLCGPRGGIIPMSKDFESPWSLRTPKGAVEMMSQLLNSAASPGIRDGPLEYIIAAKIVAFGEVLGPLFEEYQEQVMKDTRTLGKAFVKMSYNYISGGMDNHCLPTDLRSKYPDLTDKVAKSALVCADIAVNKNMIPFDSRSAFQTSGIRVGTPAVMTRSVKEDKMSYIVESVDHVLCDPENEAEVAKVRKKINEMMSPLPIFAW